MRKIEDRQVGSVQAEWCPTLPVTVLEAKHDAVDPVAVRTGSGVLLVAAESRDSRRVLLSRSRDAGATWEGPRAVAGGAEGSRITPGAGGALPSGRLVLAMHEWQDMLPSSYAGSSPLYHYNLDLTSHPAARQERLDVPGKVTWVSEKPHGVHHYSWTGFRRTSTLKVLVSDDEGKTWVAAACDTARGPIAPSAMGRVFAEEGALWLAVCGPADKKEMDAALSGVGLMRSEDDGQSWRFSHWVARADRKQGIGYGPGEIIVLPDGRWLGMLQGNYRGLGDYTRPRICRTVSSDAGRTWTTAAPILLGPKPSLALLDRDRFMVGTRQDRGVIYNMMLNAGADLLYQDQLWECIGYQAGLRGGLNLLKLDNDTVFAVYHWHGKTDSTGPSVERCEVRSQVVRRREEFRLEIPPTSGDAGRKRQWVMGEAYQVPDIPEAPSGIRIETLLKLKSGDWIAIGYGQTDTGEGSYGFTVKDFVALRSAAIEGPWRKVGLVPVPTGAAGDTGTGSNMPGVMIQTKTGRLLLPFSRGQGDCPKRRIELLCSDDEGVTWSSLGYIGQETGLSGVNYAGRMQELKNGSIVWPLHAGREGWNPAKGNLFYIVSADNGATWSKPRIWAKSQEKHYSELPHGRDGWVRSESAPVNTGGARWLGVYREERGTLAPEDSWNGPCGMPHLMLSRSADDGKSWTPAFGFLGVEPDMAVLSDGTVLLSYREDTLATAWLSYDEGHTWQLQVDPAEMPWPRDATAESFCQWPPGGESVIRVLDPDSAVVITDTGLLPCGKPVPPGHVLTREMHGRAQVRFFRRAGGIGVDGERLQG